MVATEEIDRNPHDPSFLKLVLLKDFPATVMATVVADAVWATSSVAPGAITQAGVSFAKARFYLPGTGFGVFTLGNGHDFVVLKVRDRP